jgi:hypothetical protein
MLFVFLLIAILFAAYIVFALLFNLPPFTRHVTEPPMASTTPTSTATPIIQSQTYRNTTYGFTLSLPGSWEGYEGITRPTLGTHAGNVIINVPTQDTQYTGTATPIVIDVYTPQGWDAINKTAGLKPAYLGRNKDYIFGVTLWQKIPFDYPNGKEEVQSVIDSFESL